MEKTDEIFYYNFIQSKAEFDEYPEMFIFEKTSDKIFKKIVSIVTIPGDEEKIREDYIMDVELLEDKIKKLHDNTFKDIIARYNEYFREGEKVTISEDGASVINIYFEDWKKYGYLFPIFLDILEYYANVNNYLYEEKKIDFKNTIDLEKDEEMPVEDFDEDDEMLYKEEIENEEEDDMFNDFGDDDVDEEEKDTYNIMLPTEYIEPLHDSSYLEKLIGYISRSKINSIHLISSNRIENDKRNPEHVPMKKFNVPSRKNFTMHSFVDEKIDKIDSRKTTRIVYFTN